MILLIDTCFWNHSKDIFNSNILDIRPILFDHIVVLTDAILKEIRHFQLDSFVPINQIFILPISEDEFNNYSHNSYLDVADQTLIISYDKKINENPFILTEDGELLAECIQTKRKVMNLAYFLLEAVKYKIISKNEYAKCLKHWSKRGTYKKKLLIKWKKDLQEIP